MGKLTISMVIFNSYVYVYQRVHDSFMIGNLWPKKSPGGHVLDWSSKKCPMLLSSYYCWRWQHVISLYSVYKNNNNNNNNRLDNSRSCGNRIIHIYIYIYMMYTYIYTSYICIQLWYNILCGFTFVSIVQTMFIFQWHLHHPWNAAGWKVPSHLQASLLWSMIVRRPATRFSAKGVAYPANS